MDDTKIVFCAKVLGIILSRKKKIIALDYFYFLFKHVCIVISNYYN